MKIIKIISLFLALYITNIPSLRSQISSDLAPKNLGMFIAYEDDSGENFYDTLNYSCTEPNCPVGIGAITGMVLTVLHQEACPVLISKKIWTNICKHKELFENFCNNDLSTLSNNYSQFKRFEDFKLIKDFQGECRYSHKLYEKTNSIIQNYLSYNEKNLNLLHKLFKFFLEKDPLFDDIPHHIKYFDLDVLAELSTYLLCKYALNGEFIFKDLGGAYLIIPVSYIKKIIPNYTHDFKNYNYSDNYNYQDNTEIENILGLKIDHFKDINPFDIQETASEIDQEKAFEESIYNIFIKKSKTRSIHLWKFYMIGHGDFNQDSDDELEKTNKDLEKYKQKKVDLQKQIISINKERRCFYDDPEIYSISLKIGLINKSIKSLKKHIKSIKDKSFINGIQKNRFRNILRFFNKNLNVRLLCFGSCSCGGKNINEVFATKNKLLLNFPVVSLSLTEAIIHYRLPTLRIFQLIKNNINIDFNNFIDQERNRIKILSDYNFATFFNQDIDFIYNDQKSLISESKINLDNILRNISLWLKTPLDWLDDKIFHKHKRHYLSNIPIIRYPNSCEFKIYDNLTSIIIDDKLLKKESTIKIDSNLNSIFLNSRIINRKIEISKKNSTSTVPSFISITPGKSTHIINTLYLPDFYLSDILCAFFPFGLASSKLFIINNLICKDNLIYKNNQITEFKNISLFNNSKILNSHQRTNGAILSFTDYDYNTFTYKAIWQAKQNLDQEKANNIKFILITNNNYKDNNYSEYKKYTSYFYN